MDLKADDGTIIRKESDITIGEIFSNDELNDLASHLDMLSDDQAWQVVNVINEMFRRVEAKRRNINP